MLAEFNDAKFDDLKSSVAKIQKMPSGKFLVQEFKIV